MEPIRMVRVATDFSHHATDAARRGGHLGKGLGLESGRLVHVLDRHGVRSVRDLLPWIGELDERMEEHAKQKLQRLSSELKEETGFQFDTEVLEGRVEEEFLASAGPGELIVIGGRGEHSVAEVTFGSTAERIVRKSQRPVLVVKRPYVKPYRRVVVPVDFSDDSRAALLRARELAPDAELYVLHAWPPLPREGEGFAGISDDDVKRYASEVREKAEEQLDALLKDCGIEDNAVQRLMQHGYAASFIWQQARGVGADLVAVGKHGHSRLADWLLGSVTTHVLNNCDTDILVARAE